MTHVLPRFAFQCLAVCFCAMVPCVQATTAGEWNTPDGVQFNRDVRPIFSDKCFACHGPDSNARQTDLRLDKEAGAMADLGGLRAIVPGDLDASALYHRVATSDPDERMPPVDSGAALTPREVDILRQWIEQGAPWQSHWSLSPPRRSSLPTIADDTWVRGNIDRFVLARLEREGVAASAEADRRTLIRRLSFDLLGLPPSYAQVEAFVADDESLAYERLVDRLLASRHYGERMAMYWLDLVRFADTNGIHGDNHREHAPYRDYVIAALNDNKPFDTFTIEQLAGDLLEDPTVEQRVASGYNRLNLTTREGGAQPKEYRTKYAADRVRNVAAVWLGATMGCCECHDHKFDPFTMNDFYSLAAFFADIKEEAVKEQVPELAVANAKQSAALQQINEAIAAAEEELTSSTLDTIRARLEELKAEKQQLDASIPKVLISVAIEPAEMRILPRGNWLDESGPIVAPQVPAPLGALNLENRRATRLDLARWLVASDNPVVARVMVNRLWKLFLGRGIVHSLDDFGSQGAWPTHPELLDWLAVEFIESGWDIKHMVRLIVTSSTYRQSSEVGPQLRQRDPSNALLARQSRYRFDAEVIRDNALSAAGLLSLKMNGRSAKPYQPAGYWAHLNFPTRVYEQDTGEDLYRRGVYTYWCRTFLHPSLMAFDAPSREECTVERPRSNTPLQALVLLNDPIFVEAARVFATRIVAEGGASVEQRLQFAYRTALGRDPRPEEQQVLIDLHEQHLADYQQNETTARDLLAVGQSPLIIPDGSNVAELAAWTSLARAILNLHETITRN